MSGLAVLAAVLALGTVPTIEVAEAPEGNCPSTQEVRAALERLRPGEGHPEAPPHRLFVTRTAERARVELRDAAGQTLLSRDLAVAPTDCVDAADAIALIVDRYFRELTWAPPPPSSPPEPPPAADAPAVLRVSAGPGEPARSGLPRVVLGAGPAFWTREAGVAVALAGRVRLRGPLHVGLAVLVPPFHAASGLGSMAARAEVSGVPILPSVGLGRAFGPWAATVSAAGLVTVEKGQSQSIAMPATAWRSVLAVGLGVGGARRIGERARVAVDLGGYRTVLGRSFVVDGVTGEVLAPSPWQAVASLTLEWIAKP